MRECLTHRFRVIPSSSKATTPKNINPYIDITEAVSSCSTCRSHQVRLRPTVVQKYTIACIKKYSVDEYKHNEILYVQMYKQTMQLRM